MRIFIIAILVFVLAACASSPDNLQGKNFDADSSYCRQLRLVSNNLFQFKHHTTAIKSRATNPSISSSFEPISQVQRHDSNRAYDYDCESLSALYARKNDEA